MKKFDNIRLYAWLELVIWLIIVALIVFGVRYNHYKHQAQHKNYQIFIEDVDGLIIGSPVRFLGVQIGYVKKIQILPTEVYVKFAVTEPDLSLPVGSIATVEGSGLGGSKALEIYPPNKDYPSDKLITVKEPTRLNKVMGLFDNIFKELDAIITTVNDASSQIGDSRDFNSAPKNIITPEEANTNLDKLNNSLDYTIKKQRDFMGNFKKRKGE
jgi:phospholipid/cholesterol/gamma-HCH transport system substrate-binding protein